MLELPCQLAAAVPSSRHRDSCIEELHEKLTQGWRASSWTAWLRRPAGVCDGFEAHEHPCLIGVLGLQGWKVLQAATGCFHLLLQLRL